MTKRVPYIHREGGQDKTHPTYVMNNQMVWEIISHMCKSYPDDMAAVKPYQRKMDGRDAYTALYD
eukprot:2598272-Ditylum_brightwellii.AAC.1